MKIKLLLFLSVSLFLILGMDSWATTYYVDRARADDSGNGLSWNTAKKYINSGVLLMSGGDTLIIATGTYTTDSTNFSNHSSACDKILNPPSGISKSQPTIIKANVDFGVILSSLSVGTAPGNYEAIVNIYNKSWININGLIVRDVKGTDQYSVSAFEVTNSTGIKLQKIGIRNGAPSVARYAGAVSMSDCNYSLIEDVFACGYMRYGIFFYGSTPNNHNIMRRVLVRWDYVKTTEPCASIVVYGGYGQDTDPACAYIEQQNCIDIDSNNSGSTGGFSCPHSVSYLTRRGCLSLNTPLYGFHSSESSLSHDIKNIDCIAWGVGSGFAYNHLSGGTNGTYKCTAYNTSIELWNGSSSLVTVSSCALVSSTLSNVTKDGSTNVTPAASAFTYIVRSPYASQGANMEKKIGATGTLWGDDGWNTVQTENLWPWPYEDVIKTLFSETNTPPSGCTPATNSTTRGFCAAGTTLTKYVWEYLGNTMPADIYGAVSNNPPTATASASPVSGVQPVTVNFTGSGSDTDGTIASYAWNFGDGATSTLQNPSHTYTTAGTYTAVLTVTDNGGATGTANVAINVTTVYLISGYVRDGSGAGIGAATVNLNGAVSLSTTTASSGFYQFLSLSPSASYTVTPQKTGWTFSPVSISTSSLSGNLTNRNFTGTPLYYIKGTVRDSGGAGISGVTVAMTGNMSGTVTTGSDGAYQFSNLTGGKNYTITPSKSGLTFAPVSISTTSLSVNWDGRDFVGSAALATYYIKGYARDGGGTGISGVTMALSGSATQSTLTTSDGFYQFLSLSEGGTYTVTPSKTSLNFSPVSFSTASLNANLDNRNFTGTALYYIKGYVRDSGASGISGVTVTLSGAASRSITTASDGYYEFLDLPGSNSYTVSPTKTGISFTPATISTASLSANWDNRNFTSVSAATYSIKGYVRNSAGAGVSGVSVILSGNLSRSTTTAADGSYQFTSLTGSAGYSVTPAQTGYQFTPEALNIAALSANLEDQNFTAIPLYTVSGYVKTSKGAGIGSVTVTLSGNRSASVVTGSNGLYQFTGLPAGGSYTITPNMTNYKFTPVSRTYAALAGAQVNQNFSGKRSYNIKGSVQTTSGKAISMATVILSGPVAMSTVSSSDGSYEFTEVDEDGDYTVTAAKDGYVFNPPDRSTSTLSGLLEDWNFMGLYLKSMSQGEMKVIGSTAGRGTVNPDNNETAKLYFKGKEIGRYELRIFTLAGEIVWQDTKENMQEGMFEWFPKDIASGTYVAHLKGPGIDERKKIIVLR